jgi:DNA topoisomerase VI subunit A
VSKGKFQTLRSIYYKGKLWFRNPKEAAQIVIDICCMLACTTSSLNIVAEDTGAVAGSVKLKISGSTKGLYCIKGKNSSQD